MPERWIVNTAERNLLPDGRSTGPMPWVIAIMTLLTMLAAAGGLALSGASSGLSQQLAGRLTVQIIDANVDRRNTQTLAALAELRHLSAVRDAQPVDAAHMRDLLQPWLGDSAMSGDLPIPSLIDVTLADDNVDVAAVRNAVRAVAPSANVEAHAKWLGPLAGLLSVTRWLALALIMLMCGAMSAAVVLASRAALNTHRDTIDVMHMMGATDGQIADLFQRRSGVDAAIGAGIGFVGGIILILVFRYYLSSVGAALFEAGGIGWLGMVVLALIPVAIVALAVVTARMTVMRALAAML